MAVYNNTVQSSPILRNEESIRRVLVEKKAEIASRFNNLLAIPLGERSENWNRLEAKYNEFMDEWKINQVDSDLKIAPFVESKLKCMANEFLSEHKTFFPAFEALNYTT